jgi:hypothetical protein
VSLLDIAVHDVLSLWADHKNGVCWASAEKITALCPAEFSYKSIQRSLAKLEKIGWIKRWIVRGKRGNYPVLVCRYFVHDDSMRWVSTNGTITTDWRDVKFDAVHDPSFNSPSGVRSGVREVGSELSVVVSGVQEVRRENPEVRTEGRRKRDVSPENGDMQRPETGAARAPLTESDNFEMLKTLGPRELKGLKTSLERTLSDRRIPAAFREISRQRLNEVVALLRSPK